MHSYGSHISTLKKVAMPGVLTISIPSTDPTPPIPSYITAVIDFLGILHRQENMPHTSYVWLLMYTQNRYRAHSSVTCFYQLMYPGDLYKCK